LHNLTQKKRSKRINFRLEFKGETNAKMR